MKVVQKPINAHVVLFSPLGKSITTEKQVTTANIRELMPSADFLNKATLWLQQHGFTCVKQTTGIMITAPREVYKKAFKLDFEIKQQQGISYVVPLSKPVIPTALKQVVKDIVFEEPVEPF